MSVVGSQFKDLSEFLAKHSAKNQTGVKPTHSRIPDTDLNIYGGSYIIPREELSVFHKLYYEHIFVKNRKEYLTEKQLDKDCPLLVDFDFRYNHSVEKRQHTQEHIQDMIILYLEQLKQCYLFEKNKPFDVFIFEKPNVNRLEDGSLTKDGIHMMMGINVDHTMQLIIREKMIEKLPEIWDLPLINNWEGVLDDGISKGHTNWQMYGSRKPGHEAYELTQFYIVKYDEKDGEFMMEEQKISNLNLKDNFMRISAQNDNIPKFEINPKILDLYNAKSQKPKMKRPTSKTKINLLIQDDEVEEVGISLNDIKDKESLKRAVDNMLNSLSPSEYEIREIHEYTQILPEKYYEPGSHYNNRLVAFALKHTDDRLFLSWVMLRSKASDFDYSTIPALHLEWNKNFKHKSDGVTKRSIMYWAKQDAYDDFEKVKMNTVNYYLEEALTSQTEHDIANVLFHMYKDKYVCTSYKNATWYVFNNHRWETDKGLSLRLAISKELYNVLSKKQNEIENEYQHHDPNDPVLEHLKKKSKDVSNLMIKAKRTTDKNNIMREAAELFYDKDFIRCMDTNKYLLCFENGVVDFKQKIFRDGYPQDYITKSTGINYMPYDQENEIFMKMVEEITTFMNRLFPVEELNRYMWDHLASCLIGVNRNQTFNIYNGSGSNGKSMLTDLMTHSLGEYKGIVPLSLITRDRGNIGSISSEIVQLKGIRYAVMQEPKKDTPMNEGVLKELTGDDPLQGRALWCESETFKPQFKLVVCTNVMFKITSNDDGTWRRIRKCDFMSKFVDEGEEHTDDTPYIYPKDKTLPDKLPTYAPYFMSMLVKRAFQTDGIVEDCEVVLSASKKYRKGQDFISAFVNDRIIKPADRKPKGVKKTELMNEFKLWFQQEQGYGEKVPKGQELYDYVDKIFGSHKSSGWPNIEIIYPEREDELDEISKDEY